MATDSASPILRDKVIESGLGRWTISHVSTLSFYEYCKLLNISVLNLTKDIKQTQLYQNQNKNKLKYFTNSLAYKYIF